MSKISRSCQLAVGQIGERCHHRIVFRDAHFQAQMDRERHGVKLVDNLEARLVAKVVDAGDVEQVIEGEFFLAKFRDLLQVARARSVKVVSPRNSILLLNLPAKELATRQQFRAGHGNGSDRS